MIWSATLLWKEGAKIIISTSNFQTFEKIWSTKDQPSFLEKQTFMLPNFSLKVINVEGSQRWVGRRLCTYFPLYWTITGQEEPQIAQTEYIVSNQAHSWGHQLLKFTEPFYSPVGTNVNILSGASLSKRHHSFQRLNVLNLSLFQCFKDVS